MAARNPRDRLVVGLILGIALLFVLSRTPAGAWIDLGLAPVLEVLQAPVRGWTKLRLWFEDRSRLQEELAHLRAQQARQAGLIQETLSLREENRQLKALLGVASIPGYRWHAAKVRGRSPDTMSQHLIVETEGASPDDVVVSHEGLVGLIDRVQGRHATVRTVLDASIAVPVTDARGRIAALLRGQGDRLRVDFVPRDSGIEPGTILRTSGAGGVFPPGIACARITRIEPMPGRMFLRVMAEPLAHWQRDNWLAIASRLRAADTPR